MIRLCPSSQRSLAAVGRGGRTMGKTGKDGRKKVGTATRKCLVQQLGAGGGAGQGKVGCFIRAVDEKAHK